MHVRESVDCMVHDRGTMRLEFERWCKVIFTIGSTFSVLWW